MRVSGASARGGYQLRATDSIRARRRFTSCAPAQSSAWRRAHKLIHRNQLLSITMHGWVIYNVVVLLMLGESGAGRVSSSSSNPHHLDSFVIVYKDIFASCSVV